MSDPSRILLVSLDNVGDLVFASALAPALRERFPHAALDLWCKAYAADVGHLVPGVSRVIASDPFWDRAPGSSKGKLIPFVRALRDIRRARYDVAVLASAHWRIAAALMFADVPVRIGRGRRRNRRWLTHVLPPENRAQPVVAELGGIVRALGATPRLVYRLDPAPLASRMASLAPRIPGPSRVALHAFAGDRARCVPLPVWRAVADALVRRDIDVVWVGSPRELGEIRAGGVGDRWHLADTAGTGALADSIALVALCDAFIGHDSGPLHIAAGLGVPVLGMFTPGEPQRTFPQGPGASRVIARPSPAGVTAEEMLSELDALVSLPRPTRAPR
jgi:ADP-heptose:LPS heptosyltransferase